ncbi:hypothetical protein BOX15_Mlig026656g2 [Macrostomum lignano]|uniref:Amino acid transporter transmembrane domain-containing protein n=1 Tax=Macrostomum lignano TaxID=282301 RepID=A0A267FTN0_9PLAT|nr:hypothetical protein BOX15_Mlig026656g2 [Macrostomum lignano]
MSQPSSERQQLLIAGKQRSSGRSGADAPLLSPSSSSLASAGRAGSFARTYETERGTAVRLPIGYGSVNAPASSYLPDQPGASGSPAEAIVPDGQQSRSRARSEPPSAEPGPSSASPAVSEATSAMLSRYKYYSRIAPGADSQLLMPHHVVPPQFLLILPFKQISKQSSIITIFSIWNTMMGTSLLSMPWAVKEAGFATSLVVLLIMTGITFYTAYLVLRSYSNLGRSGVRVSEFSDVCKFYLGRYGELVSVLFSAVALLGAIIVYWVLLSNFLYQGGCFIHSQLYNVTEIDGTPNEFRVGNRTFHVLCPNYPPLPVQPTGLPNVTTPPPATVAPPDFRNGTEPLFQRLWSKTETVPFYLVLLLFPLVCIKSPGFFSKFNALGTVTVVFVLVFVAVKAAQWGFHLDFSATDAANVIRQLRPSFALMTGVLSLALFCHNAVITLTRNQLRPENNTRDLLIAYVCVSITYIIVGLVFYAVYPLAKDCIEQNLLDNIPSADVLAFTARIFLFVQMVTVFPLLMYILRAQLMHYLFHSVYPSWVHVSVLHVSVMGVAIVVAVFYPNIGNILRFSGALCGLAYIFTLPPLITLLEARMNGTLTVGRLVPHCCIILIGLANFASQFFFLNK